MSPWAAGLRLGPYELIASIGAGGMGEVWQARDTRLNRIVAVKRLKGEHSARFEKEARAIAALNHPHICQIHDIGPDYLVLEYIEGQQLKGPQTVEEAVRLAAQIAARCFQPCLQPAHPGHAGSHQSTRSAGRRGTRSGRWQATPRRYHGRRNQYPSPDRCHFIVGYRAHP